MKEQLINFETAKLAKEKGFDEDVKSYYTESGEIFTRLFKAYKDKYYKVPTQSLLQKWLRENYGLNIVVYPIILEINNKKVIKQTKGMEYTYTIYEDCIPFLDVPDDFEDFEQALEKGLIEALKLIK